MASFCVPRKPENDWSYCLKSTSIGQFWLAFGWEIASIDAESVIFSVLPGFLAVFFKERTNRFYYIPRHDPIKPD